MQCEGLSKCPLLWLIVVDAIYALAVWHDMVFTQSGLWNSLQRYESPAWSCHQLLWRWMNQFLILKERNFHWIWGKATDRLEARRCENEGESHRHCDVQTRSGGGGLSAFWVGVPRHKAMWTFTKWKSLAFPKSRYENSCTTTQCGQPAIQIVKMKCKC